MSFQQGLSGLNGASKALEAISNNVSNSGTVGFKGSGVQFADMFASSMAGVGSRQVGIGTNVASVAQEFSQGNISTTNNPLDMAINGNGFFQLDNAGTLSYTRNGQFQMDKDGFIVNSEGMKLRGYNVTTTGAAGTLGDLQIPSAAIGAKATDSVTMGINLDSRSAIPTAVTQASVQSLAVPVTLTAATNQFNLTIDGQTKTVTVPAAAYANAGTLLTAVQTAVDTAFAPLNGVNPPFYGATAKLSNGGIVLISNRGGAGSNLTAADNGANTGATALFGAASITGSGTDGFSASDPTTYNNSNSVTVYDSKGVNHTLTSYFYRTGQGEWAMRTAIDGGTPSGVSPLSFSSTGALLTPASGIVTVSSTPLGTGANPLSFDISIGKSTEFGSPFATTTLTQTGYTSGQLAGLSVGSDGTIQGRYTNGQSQTLGFVALGNFANPNGLQSLGGNQWAETTASNQWIPNTPGNGGIGVLQSGALEDANVDLTKELVNMITQQRAYQANAQSIKTEDQILQTLVNLK